MRFHLGSNPRRLSDQDIAAAMEELLQLRREVAAEEYHAQLSSARNTVVVRLYGSRPRTATLTDWT